MAGWAAVVLLVTPLAGCSSSGPASESGKVTDAPGAGDRAGFGKP
jgi:hypothetical protein